MAHQKHWQDLLFKDKHGRIVYNEPPNPPVYGWAIFLLLGFVLDSGFCRWLSTAFLFAWAFMELYEGTTRAKRILGSAVLLFLVIINLN